MDDLMAKSSAARSAPTFMNASLSLGGAAGVVQYAAPVRQATKAGKASGDFGGGGASASPADEFALEATRPAELKRVVVSTSVASVAGESSVRAVPASPSAAVVSSKPGAVAEDWGKYEEHVRLALRTLQQTLSTSLSLEEDNAGGAFSTRVDLLHEMEVVTCRISLAESDGRDVEVRVGTGYEGKGGINGGNPLLHPVQTHDFGPCAVQSTRVFGCIRGFNRFHRDLEAQLQRQTAQTTGASGKAANDADRGAPGTATRLSNQEFLRSLASVGAGAGAESGAEAGAEAGRPAR